MTQHEANKDLMRETDAQMLARLSDDAHAWAAEFRKTAINLGYSDMDEGWLISWFSNAIVQCQDVVRRASRSGEFAAALADALRTNFFVESDPENNWVRLGFETKELACRFHDATLPFQKDNIEEAAASAPAAPVGDWWKPNPGDPFWMLEAEDGEWLMNEHSMLGTRDANKAIRFPKEEDANNHRARMTPGYKWWTAKATEHKWIDKATPPVPADVVERAAKAMFESNPAFKGSGLVSSKWGWFEIADDQQGYWRDLARTALAASGLLSSSGEAMRERCAKLVEEYTRDSRPDPTQCELAEAIRALPSVAGEGK